MREYYYAGEKKNKRLFAHSMFTIRLALTRLSSIIINISRTLLQLKKNKKQTSLQLCQPL